MRRRVTDNADMRLYLARFLQAVDSTGWPRHAAKVLLHIAGQRSGRIAYSKVLTDLDLSEGQLERAVKALGDAKCIVRADSAESFRHVDLQITPTGEDMIGKLDDHSRGK